MNKSVGTNELLDFIEGIAQRGVDMIDNDDCAGRNYFNAAENCFRAVKGYLSGGMNETEAAYRIDAELEWVRIHWISQQLPECK